jgi:carboxymethylenebutenolidase
VSWHHGLYLVLIAVVQVVALVATAPRVHSADCTIADVLTPLSAQIPEVIGECLDKARPATDSGDLLQETTNGTLVLRRADAVVAFTNGQTTWLIGPRGIEQRQNSDRFDWEIAATTAAEPTPRAVSPAAPISWTPASAIPCEIDETVHRATFLADADRVTAAVYRPAGDGPFPAALVLHTANGFGAHEIRVARRLADAGFVALAPDYFSAVGLSGPWLPRDGCPPGSPCQRAYVTEADRVREALARGIDCLRSMPSVDGERIGVLGFSLGSYYGWLLTTRPDVRAAVLWYAVTGGGDVGGVAARYGYLTVAAQSRAQILVLQGEADRDGSATYSIVAAATRRAIERGAAIDLVTYPGVGHGFDLPNAPGYHPPTAADAWQRTLAFLRSALG